MKNKFLSFCINLIKTNKKLTFEEEATIKYGLEGLYFLVTKLFVITLLAIVLGLFIEYLIFMIFYSIIRSISFGLHAKKSWMCWVSSTLTFIIVPFICKHVEFNNYFISIIGIITILAFYKNAPADTEKKPIVSPKRRLVYKYLSVFICIIFTIISLSIENSLISNCLIFALLVQSFMISPFVYKIFRLKYNNYKTYLSEAI